MGEKNKKKVRKHIMKTKRGEGYESDTTTKHQCMIMGGGITMKVNIRKTGKT